MSESIPNQVNGQPAPMAGQALHTPDERTMAALAHGLALLNLFAGLGGVIAAGVIWLTQKEKSAWVGWHALQALVFQALQLAVVVVGVGVVWVIGFAISFLTLGFGAMVAVPVMILSFFLGFAVIAAGTVYSCYGAYQIYEGREFEYFWVGGWLRKSNPRPV